MAFPERYEEAVKVVRALAAESPIAHDEFGTSCTLCDADELVYVSGKAPDLYNVENHQAKCPWKMAKIWTEAFG